MSVLSPPTSTKDASTTSTATPAPRAVSPHVRPRASLMATMSLAAAVAAVFTVATGVLAGPGAALGLAAALMAVGGITATRQRHVAGTGNAVLGLLLGLVALAVGALTVADNFPWLDTATNNVTRLHEWLSNHAPWTTPDMRSDS